MAKPRIGIALCGSYCTYDKLFSQLVLLSDKYELVPIMSETAAATDTRFGKAADFLSRLESLCGAKPVCSIAEAEPLGPAKPMEALIIAPCTGNTMAKLNHGITDTAVTMAAKAHLRNSKPLIIAFSTNDALSGSAGADTDPDGNGKRGSENRILHGMDETAGHGVSSYG